MLKKHVFGSLNLNNSEIFRLSFEDTFWGTLDTYMKKMNAPSAVLGGGVVGALQRLLAHSLLMLNKCFRFLATLVVCGTQLGNYVVEIFIYLFESYTMV